MTDCEIDNTDNENEMWCSWWQSELRGRAPRRPVSSWLRSNRRKRRARRRARR